jgi:hypothetical protein
MRSGERCTRPDAAGLARSTQSAPHNSGLRIIAADTEPPELVLHELRQRVAALVKAREEARQVTPDQHGRVAVVGPPRDVDAWPWTRRHGAHPCTRAATPDHPEVGGIARTGPLPHPLPGQRAGHPGHPAGHSLLRRCIPPGPSRHLGGVTAPGGRRGVLVGSGLAAGAPGHDAETSHVNPTRLRAAIGAGSSGR